MAEDSRPQPEPHTGDPDGGGPYGGDSQAAGRSGRERPPIEVSVGSTHERKKRQREFWLAIGLVLFIIGLTYVELQYIGADSYLFIALFNLNFVLLVVILAVVLRNMVKLLLERRRSVLGSRLRTKLVFSFLLLSLVPTALMFVVSIQFVQTSVNYWFEQQVENALETSLEVGQQFYTRAQKRVERLGTEIVGQIREREYAWGGKGMTSFLEDKHREYGLSMVGVVNPDRTEQNWIMEEGLAGPWIEVKSMLDWDRLEEEPRFWSTMHPAEGADLIVGVLPVDDGKTGYLVVGSNIGQGLLYKLDEIVRGVDEYKKLKSLKSPLKFALYVSLGVMGLLIILAAMWFGIRLAKELSAPVQALAVGTQRIARGDLSVRLDDRSSDELGFLVQSFNRMAADLEEGRERVTTANERLARQNLELESRGRYMEAVLDNITAGVVSIDHHGRISTVNTAAETMLGLVADEVIGKRPVDLLDSEYAELVGEVLSRLSGEPEARWQRQMEITLTSRGLKLLVNVVSLGLIDNRPAGAVAVFEDITELEKIQRLAAWREVARRIAHEIKNPLTPIKLSAQRLQRRFADTIDDPVFSESTELIVGQVENMQQMVKEFSAFAKLPEVRPRTADIRPLLEQVVALFATSHGHIAWRLHMPKDLPRMAFDPDALKRVFINLLGNAADALGDTPHGHVEVQAEHDTILGLLRIEVRDNGPGLTADERSRVFEPYFSRKQGGTGLGLTIVRSIVTDHRGYVRVRRSASGGTAFVVELPIDSEQTTSAAS